MRAPRRDRALDQVQTPDIEDQPRPVLASRSGMWPLSKVFLFIVCKIVIFILHSQKRRGKQRFGGHGLLKKRKHMRKQWAVPLGVTPLAHGLDILPPTVSMAGGVLYRANRARLTPGL